MALRAKGAGGDGHSVVAREEGEAGVEGMALGVPGDAVASWRWWKRAGDWVVQRSEREEEV